MITASRRQFLLSLSSLGAISSCGRFLPLAFGNSNSVLASEVRQPALTIFSIEDPRATSLITRYFPGLLSTRNFALIAPYTYFVTNTSRAPIAAMEVQWHEPLNLSSEAMTTLYYFHPRNQKRAPMHWGLEGNKTRYSGKVSVIKPGQTRLLTPFSNWSHLYYALHRTVDWSLLVNRRGKYASKLASSVLNGKLLSCSITGQINKDLTFVGSDTGQLKNQFAVSRNAEHDEAYSVLLLLKSGASKEDVSVALKKHASGSLDRGSKLYRKVRQRQAKVLLRRLQSGTWKQFIRTLNYLARKRKTTFSIS